MRANVCTWAVMLLALTAVLRAQPNASTAPATAPSDDIAALIQQMGSDSYETRQHAQDELIKLGLAAKPALEQAARSDNSPEVRSRAAHALRQINDNQPDSPTYVTIHVADANPNAVLREFIQQSRIPIQAWPPQMWSAQWARAPRITLDVDHEAFWPAMLQFCKAANARPWYMNQPNQITIMQGSDRSTDGVLFHQGQFSFVAASIQHERTIYLSDNSSNNSDAISLTILIDPRARLERYWEPRLTQAIDENNVSLLPGTQAIQPQGQMPPFCNWMIQTTVRLEYPQNVGHKLVHCKGVLPVCLVTQTKTLRIPDLAKAIGADVTEAGKTVHVNSFNFANGNGQLHATITQPADRRGQGFPQLWADLRRVRILDADGNEIQSNSGGGGAETRIEWTWNLNCQTGPPPKPPFSLVWDIVTETRNQDIGFEFANLPLPPR
ncbi:MAG: HEAT repeat domain-containing protein [Tepidisphaeraceae bacterium]